MLSKNVSISFGRERGFGYIMGSGMEIMDNVERKRFGGLGRDKGVGDG
jgi:hypothetical protein